MRLRHLAIGAGIALAPAAAAARPPAYAHKAGVAPEQYDAEVGACWNDAIKAMNDPSFRPSWTPNPATESTTADAAGGALARGVADGIMGGKRFKLTYYDCLNAKGYTLRRPTDADQKAYKKLSKPDRVERMLAWRSAASPTHPIAPREEFD